MKSRHLHTQTNEKTSKIRKGFSTLSVVGALVIVGALGSTAMVSYSKIKDSETITSMRSDLKNATAAEYMFYSKNGYYAVIDPAITDPISIKDPKNNVFKLRVSKGNSLRVDQIICPVNGDSVVKGFVALVTNNKMENAMLFDSCDRIQKLVTVDQFEKTYLSRIDNSVPSYSTKKNEKIENSPQELVAVDSEGETQDFQKSDYCTYNLDSYEVRESFIDYFNGKTITVPDNFTYYITTDENNQLCICNVDQIQAMIANNYEENKNNCKTEEMSLNFNLNSKGMKFRFTNGEKDQKKDFYFNFEQKKQEKNAVNFNLKLKEDCFFEVDFSLKGHYKHMLKNKNNGEENAFNWKFKLGDNSSQVEESYKTENIKVSLNDGKGFYEIMKNHSSTGNDFDKYHYKMNLTNGICEIVYNKYEKQNKEKLQYYYTNWNWTNNKEILFNFDSLTQTCSYKIVEGDKIIEDKEEKCLITKLEDMFVYTYHKLGEKLGKDSIKYKEIVDQCNPEKIYQTMLIKAEQEDNEESIEEIVQNNKELCYCGKDAIKFIEGNLCETPKEDLQINSPEYVKIKIDSNKVNIESSDKIKKFLTGIGIISKDLYKQHKNNFQVKEKSNKKYQYKKNQTILE